MERRSYLTELATNAASLVKETSCVVVLVLYILLFLLPSDIVQHDLQHSTY